MAAEEEEPQRFFSLQGKMPKDEGGEVLQNILVLVGPIN